LNRDTGVAVPWSSVVALILNMRTLDVQSNNGKVAPVIVGYLDDATRDIHAGTGSRAARRFGEDVRRVARRKLDLLG
jgi:hypothetical protein